MASSSICIPRTYDVFLSFRGEDTRRNFTDHLYSNLVAYGIHTFRDDEELEKGGDIASDLSKAIEDSRIFLIIFSKNYAQSSWCLNELVKIMESTPQMQKESIAIPVFYHVEPSDVRKQLGSFGDAFTGHERDADADEDDKKKEMIQKWRSALKKAADLSGYHVDDQKYETEVIEEIREALVRRLNRKILFVGDNIVGMSFHLEQLRSLIQIELNEVRMIGIYGIGGIGKTTIALAICNEFSSQFDGSSFLRVDGEKSKRGLLELQQKLLQDVLKGKRPEFNDISEGINAIKEKLCSKRVLIILDDVDELKQLETLIGKYGWFGAKSRIIITTKNTQLLDVHGVKALYEVKELNDEDATELFNWCAFKQNVPTPKEDFESLSNRVVKYASGLPIALKVLGHFLYGMTIFEWESALHQLEKMPRKEILSVLKVSYDKLEEYEKDIFLDIACFFRGSNKDFVSRILGDEANVVIKVLHDRCLISISEDKIEMHDLLERMGREIVRQHCPKEPGGRSRLWDLDDIKSVFRRNTGTEAIEGIFVETYSEIKFTTKAFKKMNRLRLLSIRDFSLHDMQISKDFEFPSYELRYLYWHNYRLESLPTNFYAKKLVELKLRGSTIKHLWRETKFDKLKVMDLGYSKDLIEIPNFRNMPNLEILCLQGCTSLESLPSDFYKLRFLQELSCNGCSKLRSFPNIKSNMCELRKFDLSETGIVEVPSSIGLLNALEYLNLSECQNLVNLPESISNLSCLKALHLRGCPDMSYEWGCLSGLCSLPELCLDGCHLKRGLIRSDNCFSSLKKLSLRDCNVMEGEILNQICHLSSLRELSLHGNHFSRIPDSISGLSNLELLDLTECKRLVQIPELPPNLRLLDAHGSLSSSRFLLLNSLLNCFQSECQALESRWNWYFFDCSFYSGPGVCIIIPGGGRIPDWIWNKREGSEIEIELPKHWYENSDFWGFVISLAFVPSHDEYYGNGPPPWTCCLNIYGNNQSAKMDRLGFGTSPYVSTVLVFYYPKVAIEERYRSDQWTHIKVSLAPTYKHTGKVTECGVYLIDDCCSDCQQNVECQRKLCLRGNASSELPTINHPSQVDSLCLRDCKNLEGLSTSICEFKSLKTLSCSGSSLLTRFPEFLGNMGNLKHLSLDGTAIEELPSSIQHLRELQYLNLENCNNLVSLPESICHLKSLVFLSCFGCSQLKEFPKILENMGNLREVDFSRTALEELPSSVERLQGLQHLYLKHCNNLVNLPETICNLSFLQTLVVSFCSKLEKFPRNLGSLQCLETLKVAGLDWDLIQGAIRGDVSYLSSSEALNLSMNHFSSILPGISQLSKLRALNLSHCQKLLQIPELPSSLRLLDAHNCTNLETLSSPSSLLGFSLFKCFKSSIQEFESRSHRCKGIDVIISGSSGIPEWLSHRKKGSEMIVELPWDWYQNNDFLGFALFSIHTPLANDSKKSFWRLECELNFHEFQFEFLDDLSTAFWIVDGLSSECWAVDDFYVKCRYSCCHNGGESNRMWVSYYPKLAIKEEYHSSKWRHLRVSYTDSEQLKVEECGFHLIYMPDEIINTTIPRCTYIHYPRNCEDTECSGDTVCSEDIECSEDTICSEDTACRMKDAVHAHYPICRIM